MLTKLRAHLVFGITCAAVAFIASSAPISSSETTSKMPRAMNLAQQVERRVLPSAPQNIDKFKVGRNVTSRLQRTEQRISDLEKQIASLKGRPVRPAPSDTISPGDKERLSELIDRTKFRRAVLEAIQPELERIENEFEELRTAVAELATLKTHTHNYAAHGHGYTNIQSLIAEHDLGDPRLDQYHHASEGCKQTPENCLVAVRSRRSGPLEATTKGPN